MLTMLTSLFGIWEFQLSSTFLHHSGNFCLRGCSYELVGFVIHINLSKHISTILIFCTAHVLSALANLDSWADCVSRMTLRSNVLLLLQRTVLGQWWGQSSDGGQIYYSGLLWGKTSQLKGFGSNQDWSGLSICCGWIINWQSLHTTPRSVPGIQQINHNTRCLKYQWTHKKMSSILLWSQNSNQSVFCTL